MWLKNSLVLVLVHVTTAQTQPAKARFHHVHLNATDPAAAVNFYATKFEAEKRKFADGTDAVWANESWLLFTNVAAAPKHEITSGIWHIGWGGGAKMKETYRKQLDSGTKFHTPLTDLSDQCDGKKGNERFLFAYVDGPDHALIELNTTAAGNQRFGHVHLLSEDPIATGKWYVKQFGATPRGTPTPQPRYRCGRQTGPSFSMMMDDVNLIVYPVGNAKAAFPNVWQNRKELESSAGHAIDHIAFGVDDLDGTLKKLRSEKVNVLSAPRRIAQRTRSAMIEGPDRVRIELIEEQ